MSYIGLFRICSPFWEAIVLLHTESTNSFFSPTGMIISWQLFEVNKNRNFLKISVAKRPTATEYRSCELLRNLPSPSVTRHRNRSGRGTTVFLGVTFKSASVVFRRSRNSNRRWTFHSFMQPTNLMKVFLQLKNVNANTHGKSLLLK